MKRVMVIAGETSGDLLAAELVTALKRGAKSHGKEGELEFFGAGGPAMQAVGVDLTFDMPAHALVGLLPGSRPGELARHLPVMREAIERLSKQMNLRWRMVVPQQSLAEMARTVFAGIPGGEVLVGTVGETLREADLAIASTGTVTLEC